MDFFEDLFDFGDRKHSHRKSGYRGGYLGAIPFVILIGILLLFTVAAVAAIILAFTYRLEILDILSQITNYVFGTDASGFIKSIIRTLILNFFTSSN